MCDKRGQRESWKVCKITEFLYPRESGATVRSIPGAERRARVFGDCGEWVRAIEREGGRVRAREHQSWG